eukprot:690523-Rhodomonas_salina.1
MAQHAGSGQDGASTVGDQAVGVGVVVGKLREECPHLAAAHPASGPRATTASSVAHQREAQSLRAPRGRGGSYLAVHGPAALARGSALRVCL